MTKWFNKKEFNRDLIRWNTWLNKQTVNHNGEIIISKRRFKKKIEIFLVRSKAWLDKKKMNLLVGSKIWFNKV